MSVVQGSYILCDACKKTGSFFKSEEDAVKQGWVLYTVGSAEDWEKVAICPTCSDRIVAKKSEK